MLPIYDHLPPRRAPLVTYLLLAVNVAAFLWQRALLEVGYGQERLVFGWGLVPARLLLSPETEWLRVLTSMFMHDPSGWLHLGGNMLFLWIFGDNVEDAMGSGRFAAFYLLAGLGAAAAQVFIDPTSTIPMVGASGAISGVLAAYGSLYPRAPVTILNPILPLWFVFGITFVLPAWVVILEYFVMNLFQGVMSIGRQTGGVAFFAHLGGFVAGLLLVRLFMLGRLAREHDRVPGFGRASRPPRGRGGPAGW